MMMELQFLMELLICQVHFQKTTRKLMQILWNERCQQGHGYFVEGAEHGSLNILGSLLGIHQCGKELQMGKTSLVSNFNHAYASLCAESNALVYIMELAVKSIVGVPKAAKTGSGDVTVQRVSAEAGNAHALLLDVNVILMFVEIVGLVVGMVH